MNERTPIGDWCSIPTGSEYQFAIPHALAWPNWPMPTVEQELSAPLIEVHEVIVRDLLFGAVRREATVVLLNNAKRSRNEAC